MRFKIPKLNVFGELAGLGMPHNFIYLLCITFIRIPSLEVVPSRFLYCTAMPVSYAQGYFCCNQLCNGERTDNSSYNIYKLWSVPPPPTPADLITLQISIFSGSDITAQEPGWCGFRTIGPCHLVIWYLCPLFTSVELEYFISFSI